MLVISRRPDGQTVITVPPSDRPTVIVHTQLEVRGDKVRHAWEAPKCVTVDRMEVHQAKERDNRASGAGPSVRVDPYVPR